MKGHISKILELREDPKNVIIDLRIAWAYEVAHIEGTINVPNLPEETLLERICAIALDRGAPIYLFCMSGTKSESACEVLEEMGYLNVCDLGSFSGWKNGFETPFGFQPYGDDDL